MRQYFLLICQILIFIPFLSSASDKQLISGTVFCSSDHKPLPGAHVLIKGTHLGQVTDSSGYFIFRDLTEGKYTIRVTFIGYQSQEHQVILANGKNTTVDFFLEPDVLTSPEIEITGNRATRDIQSIPLRIDQITSSLIQENPGRDISNVLDYISGVNLNTTMGMFSNNSVVSMRGLSGNDQGRTLVLIDGMPVNKADEGTVNWHLVNRDNVERIEVIKGPGSALYGSNAMGGVINIQTRRPTRPISGSASVEYGTYNTFNGRYFLTGKLKSSVQNRGLYYNLNGFYTRSDGYNAEIQEYLAKDDTFTVNSFLREAGIGLKTGYQFNEKNSLELGVNFYDDKRGRGVEIYEVDGAFERHRTWNVMARYQGGKGILRWNLQVYNLDEHFERLNEYMKESEYNLYLVKSNRIDRGGTASLAVVAGKHQTITGGFDARLGSVDGKDIYYTSTDLISNAGKIDNYGIFLQDEINILQDRLQINAGLRIDYARFHDGAFSIEDPSYSIEYMLAFQDTVIPSHEWIQVDPKLSLQYRFNTHTRIYVSVARGFRAPILDDLCRSGKKSNGFKIANPALQPEYLDNFEIGADIELLKKIRLAGSVFYSIGHNFMYYVSTGDSINMGYKIAPVFQKRNISRVDIFGVEIDLDYAPFTWLSLYANYSFAYSTINRFESTDTIIDKDLTGKFLTDVPMHKATAGIRFTNKYCNVNLLWKYVGSRWINDENEPDPVLQISKFPAYSTFSLKIWHTFFKRLTVALNADNIFDVRFIDDRLQRSPGRMITAEVSVSF